MKFRVSRLGCLAVHLMTKYTGRELTRAVKRIEQEGPTGEFEREAVEKANRENVPDPLIPTAREDVKP